MTKREFEAALDRLGERLVKLRAYADETEWKYDLALLAGHCEYQDIAHELEQLRTALAASGRKS